MKIKFYITPREVPNLSGADLIGADLSRANLMARTWARTLAR